MIELPTLYQQIIHQSRYARFLPEKNRRETWEETVDRLINYLHNKVDSLEISEESKTYIKERLG